MRGAAWVVVLVACGAPRTIPPPVPPAPTPTVTPSAPKRDADIVDRDTFEIYVSGEVVARQSFVVRRSGSHLLLSSSDPDQMNGMSGELEVDDQFRPVRAAYEKRVHGELQTDKLGGSPLTLEISRPNKPTETHVADGAVDIFLDGPGLIAYSALCRIDGEVTLRMLSGGIKRAIQAYVAPPYEQWKRVVLAVGDDGYEFVCDRTRLVMGRFHRFGTGIARESSREQFEAFVASPELPPHVWPKLPQNPLEPYSADSAWLVDGKVLVVSDLRERMLRLTAVDATSGTQTAQRDLEVRRSQRFACLPMTAGRLVCNFGAGEYLQILDARTLADKQDLAPLVRKAKPPMAGEPWSLGKATGEQVDVLVGLNVVHVNAKSKVATFEKSQRADDTESRGPTDCRSEGSVKVGKEVWSIDELTYRTEIERTAGKQQLSPIVLGLRYMFLLGCKPKRGGVLVVGEQNEKKVLALLTPDTKLAWQVEIGAVPRELFLVGGTHVVIATTDLTPRIVSIDTVRGTVAWTWPASSP